MLQDRILAEHIESHFGKLEDPRNSLLCRHKLIDILGVAILAVICGADEWTEIEEYGNSKIEFLEKYFELPNGIPSHDTFGRFFRLLNPKEFEEYFAGWAKSMCEILEGDIINLDGKQLRGSYDTIGGKSSIYMVSAWSNANNLVLGQVKVDEKSNEITAIPKLLDLVEIKGSVVTIDAMGTQKKVAKKIRAKEADYVLALKGNQSNLHKEVQGAFKEKGGEKQAAINEELEADHGRIEQRKCYVLPASEWIKATELSKWKDLNTIIKIESKVFYKNGKKEGKTSYEERYYISSLAPDAAQLNHVVRQHWGIETKVHWILDVAFCEDKSRVRTGHGDENFSILRKIALNKIKKDSSVKRGIKTKRKKAGWNDDFLLEIFLT